MNRDDHLNNCAKYFGRLTHEIRSLNAMGRFDINSVTEDFLVPILKLAFDCPELQNQNTIQYNFPAVDLGCRKSKLSFQVTTDASSAKIVKTLDKFREHSLEKLFDRVLVLTLTDKQSSYSAKPLENAIASLPVSFDPSKDILDVDDLISRIRCLDTSKLGLIESYFASEFKKRDAHLLFRDQLNKFLEVSQAKIEVEKNSKKYIPSIFIETHATKEEMRFFAHPLFFSRKAGELLAKLDYSHLNSLLGLAREPAINIELDKNALARIPTKFSELKTWLDDFDQAVDSELKKVGPLSWDHREYGAPYEPAEKDSARWTIARHQLESGATAQTWRLKKAKSLTSLMRKKFFLVTSMAGQGKTNFVCDLVENQFRPFEIPCVFIPARELNSYPARQRLRGFLSNNRYAPTFSNIHEYLALFESVASESGKPFLLVIDGINEVTALDEFNDELKDFCNAVAQYDLVKVVITCRSEFFDEKYASILNEPFSKSIHRVTDLRSKMSGASKDRLLKSYLRYFNISGQLGKVAQDFLKNDLLLLRIFCERHENEHVGHLADIYKGDLFEEFLVRKIKSFPEHLRSQALPTLLKIASAMLTADDYSKLSVRDFRSDEKEIVHHLVADDVILRQEIAAEGLSGLGELVISFTYDELRDFIIAYKLVTDDDTNALQDSLQRLPDLPIFEGVYKYVYLLARKANKASAIEVCERAPSFNEHFILNVHLLPPAVQNANDVDRLKAILTDTAVERHVRRAALLLIQRRTLTEPINISILIEHLNGLRTDDHRRFAQAIFSDPNYFGPHQWVQRIDELVENVCSDGSTDALNSRTPEWLAFFLHASSLAGWSSRERVSMLFRNALSGSNCRIAIDQVRVAQSQTIRRLLSDIEEPVEPSNA